MSDRSLPTFFLLGAPKAGTTALYSFLKQHPNVYLPDRKEPHHFAYRDHPLNFAGPADERIMRHMVIRDPVEYRALYAGRREAALGDASVMQLYVEGTEGRIREAVPDARFVIVLRDPVERAFSSWLHLVRDDRETLSFEEGLRAEERRVAEGWIPLWHYTRASRYAEQLERWFSAFPREKFLILFHDDLRRDPAKVLETVFTFLNVDPTYPVSTSLERNVSGVPKNRMLQRVLSRPHPAKDLLNLMVPRRLKEPLVAWLRNRNVAGRPELASDTETHLRQRFADDIERLQTLVDRDLRRWLP